MRPPGVLPFALLAAVALALALGGAVEPLGAGLLGVALAALGLAAALAPGLPAPSAAALGPAGVWTALLLLSLTWSASRDAALDGAAGGLTLVVAWLLGSLLVDAGSRRRFALGLAALGVAVAAAALAAAQPGERAAFPLHNPNHLGAWLLLPAGFAAAALFHSDVRRRGARESAFLWFGVAGVVGAGFAASGSRGAALAALVAGAAYGGLRLSGPRGVPWLVSGLAVAALLLMGGPLAAPDALAVSAGGEESSAGLRWSLYAVSARAALDTAPLGAGLGAFGSVFAAHRPDGVAYATRFAHNEALHGLVELGLPFALSVGITAAVLASRVRRRLERGGSRVTWGALVALVALAAHALVDFPLHVPAVALTGAALAGLLVADPETGAAQRGRGRALLALGSVLLLASSLTQTGAALAERRAGDELERGDFAGAFATATRGLRLRPGRAALHARVAEAAEHVHRFGGGGRPWLERALAARDAAVASDPGDARVWLDRAHTRAMARDRGGALADLAEAERRDPRSPVAALARARLWLSAGEPDRAARELRRALQRHPRAAPAAVAAALRDTDDASWVRAAVGGLGRSERDAAAVLARAGYWRDAAAAWGSVFDAEPEDTEAALAAAELLVRAGERLAASRILERLAADAADEPRLRRLRAATAAEAAR